MVGMGSIKHLEILVNETGEYRDTLWNGTAFRERDDVYMKYNEHQGKLTVAPSTGYAAKNCFGPELMFGWTVGDALNETVVLIKAAYGGRTLADDFRPPASGEGNYDGIKPSHYGWEYRQMVQDINDGLNSIDKIVPNYDKDAGYELSGFVWFQGWNDMLNWPFVKEYGFNLINFIRDVRKEFDAPELPFVVGELGMHGLHPTGRGSDRVMAMRAIERGVTMMSEFRNTTLFVPTALYVVSNGTSYNGAYHYNGRADTYFHIGQAFGRGMLQIMGKNETALKTRLRGAGLSKQKPVFGSSLAASLLSLVGLGSVE